MNKLLIIVSLTLLFTSCKDKEVDNIETYNFDFEAKTGLSENEFYEFINYEFRKSYPEINKLFINPDFPNRIVYDSLSPPEPTAQLSVERKFYQLKKEKLIGYDLITLDEYLEILKKQNEDHYCEAFEKEIGIGFALFSLPWYNSKDSTMVFRNDIINCYSYCGGNILMVYKKANGRWEKIM